MTGPEVSIVLPTFNRLQYLRPAVNSVLAQTFTDWELIVADDGSDDEAATANVTSSQIDRDPSGAAVCLCSRCGTQRRLAGGARRIHRFFGLR